MNVTSPNVSATVVSATVSGLIPFANYRVSVKCIWLVELSLDSFAPRGYWSNAAYISFTTETDGEPIVTMYTTVVTTVDGRPSIYVT